MRLCPRMEKSRRWCWIPIQRWLSFAYSAASNDHYLWCVYLLLAKYISMAVLRTIVTIWFISICYPIFRYLSLPFKFSTTIPFCHYVISMVGPTVFALFEIGFTNIVNFTSLRSYVSGLFGSHIHYSYNTRISPYFSPFHVFFLALGIFHRYAPSILPLSRSFPSTNFSFKGVQLSRSHPARPKTSRLHCRYRSGAKGRSALVGYNWCTPFVPLIFSLWLFS